MQRYRLSTKACLIFFPLLLLMTSAATARAADSIVMGMAGLNFSFLPFQVAAEKKFYQKHGLEVKPVLMRAQSAIPALVSGDVDYDTHFGSLVRAAVSGLPLRVIFSTAEKQMFSLVVQPEIKSIADLKGKIIGISSFGGTQHVVTAGVLEKAGLNQRGGARRADPLPTDRCRHDQPADERHDEKGRLPFAAACRGLPRSPPDRVGGHDQKAQGEPRTGEKSAAGAL
jgi:hypothetical protein